MVVFRAKALRLLILLVPFPFIAGAVHSQNEDGRFLLISDIHFDPFYDPALFRELDSAPAENWPAILQKSRPAGRSPQGRDSNYALVEMSLDDACKRLPDPDFVLCAGDLLAHDWQRQYSHHAKAPLREVRRSYNAFTAKAMQFLAAELHRRYPKAAILTTPGNNDSDCGDYATEPDGVHLRMFATVWAPLIDPGGDSRAFQATIAHGGYYRAELRHANRHCVIALNSTFFSTHYDNRCGNVTQTPGLDEIEWLASRLAEARAAGQAVWLLMHIPPGIDSHGTAGNIKNGGEPVAFWQPEMTSRFAQLVKQFRGTLQIAFAGHTHMDDFRLIRLDGEPVLLTKIAPAISPVFKNSPAYQIYHYSRETGAIVDYETIYLPSPVTEATAQRPVNGPAAPPSAPQWASEYRFENAYGFARLSAQTVEQLAGKVKTDSKARQNYMKYYTARGTGGMKPDTVNVYRAAISSTTAAEFWKDYLGEGAPDH